MLYLYYMKINFSRFFTAFLAIFLYSCALAQVTVVKQDGEKIYLDTSELNRNVSVGETFKIITGQEKLTNPKTGKDLGYIYHYSAEGKIIEVQPLYAVGRLSEQGQYAAGQEAVISPLPQTAVSAPDIQTQDAAAAQKTLVSNRKIKTYPVIQHEIISAVKADLSAFPGDEIAALDTKGHLFLYTEENNTLRMLAETKLPAGKTPLTLSALDLMKSGRPQLFVTMYDPRKQKISTLVLDVVDHEFKELDSLPYFVKELGCGENKKLYAQKPFTSGVKGGDARELIYEKNRFLVGETVFDTRGNWLTGLNWYPIQTKEKNNFLYTADTGKLRLKLDNGKYAEAPSLFATAPNRVKYKQDIISFFPSVQAYGPAGRATLAAVQNMTRLGILSESFGSYKSSKIHFLTYENGTLDVRESVELDGFLYDTNCTAHGILAPQVLSGGQTVLTEIYR